MITVKLSKIGNSFSVRIPLVLTKLLEWDAGDSIELKLTEDTMTLKKVAEVRKKEVK